MLHGWVSRGDVGDGTVTMSWIPKVVMLFELTEECWIVVVVDRSCLCTSMHIGTDRVDCSGSAQRVSQGFFFQKSG
jgi:hypothetical protein